MSNNINRQPDFSQAPEGATHYHCHRDGYVDWYRVGEKTEFWHQDGVWFYLKAINPSQAMAELDKIPETRQETPASSWGGTGMPPVGSIVLTACLRDAVSEMEFRYDKHSIPSLWSNGDRLLIIAHVKMYGEEIPAAQHLRTQEISTIQTRYLRPLPTEREEFIAKVREIFSKVESQSLEDLANALYDANARFPEDSK